MPVNITNRAGCRGNHPRADCIQYFSGCTEKFRIYGNGKKTSKYDIQSD